MRARLAHHAHLQLEAASSEMNSRTRAHRWSDRAAEHGDEPLFYFAS